MTEISAPEGTWVLIPVHNRKDITLDGLENLKQTQDWEGLNILVVDDGSTDGTYEAVSEQYPGVEILRGDGSLWWGGAMEWGMKHAMEEGANVLVWLNDDVHPEPGSVAKLAKKADELGDTVLGSVVYPEPEPELGYNYTTRWGTGLFSLRSMPYEGDKEIQYCELVSGKMVAIPRKVVEEIGYPNVERFHHHNSDLEYTYRATEHGFDVGVYSEARAKDIGFDHTHSGLSSEVSLLSVVKGVFDPECVYSISKKYDRDKRFSSLPRPIVYGYNLIKGIGTIAIKLALCLRYRDQKLTSDSP